MHQDHPLLLVVDDETTVLRYISNALRTRRFEFILAEDGERGLDLFTANKDKIDLILTDVSMPRMNGLEMARQIRMSDSQARLIFMTGFSPSYVVPKEFAGFPWLRKPFTPQELFEAVDHCLKDGQHN